MKPKAISFTPEVLKAKLRALEKYGRCQTRRPLRPQPVEIDARGGGRIWHLETRGRGFINSNLDGTWPIHMTRGVRDQDGRYYPPVVPIIIGQILWIRERARVLEFAYGASGPMVRLAYDLDSSASPWLPYPQRLREPVVGRCIPNGVHREGARHFLEVVDVRAERVAAILEQDALLEGMDGPPEWAQTSFFAIYDSIYGTGAHARDWCWVYTLKRAEP